MHSVYARDAWSGHTLMAHHWVPHRSSCTLHHAWMHLLCLHLASMRILLRIKVSDSCLGCCIMLKSTGHASMKLVHLVEIL